MAVRQTVVALRATTGASIRHCTGTTFQREFCMTRDKGADQTDMLLLRLRRTLCLPRPDVTASTVMCEELPGILTPLVIGRARIERTSRTSLEVEVDKFRLGTPRMSAPVDP